MPTTVEPARGQRAARSIVVVLGCAAALFAITTFARRYGLADLAVHRAAVRNWLDGAGLYGYSAPDTGLRTALPPVAALALAPLAFLPLWTGGALLGAAGVVVLVLALTALIGPVARRYGRRRWPAVFAATALALIVEPVRAALGLGALDLLVFGLITGDVIALRRGAWVRSRDAWWPGRPASAPPRGRSPAELLRRCWTTGAWAGVGTGVATALAVSPVLFLGYLAVTRQWRPVLTALGTTATLAGTAALVAPRESTAWAGDVVWRLDRGGAVDRMANQSLAAVLARLYDSATIPVLLWLSFALLVTAVGLIRARAAHADGDEITAFTLVGLTGAVVDPISDTHELVWVLPAILILGDAAARQRAAGRPPHRPRCVPGLGYAAFAAVVYLLFVSAPMGTASGPLAANAYALALILLVNVVPWRPGVAPAFMINRWMKRTGRRQPIPPARRPVA